MKNYIFYILILLTTSYFIKGESEGTRFDSLVYEGIHHIYNLRFDSADSLFNIVKSEYPDHPAGTFFEGMVVWWQIMIDFDNKSLDEKLVENLEKVIEQCDEILDEHPDNVDAIFFKGGALGFRGKLYSIRKDWLNAALDGKDALPLVHQAYALAPANQDVQLGFGIYNYYAAVIPEKYPFVKPFMLFFPEGNKKKGIEQLEIAADSGKYSRYEARYFLATLFLLYEKNYDKALKYLNSLLNDFPLNPVFNRYHALAFYTKRDYKKADSLYHIIIERNEQKLKGYSCWLKREAHYYLGKMDKKFNRLNSAFNHFLESERISILLDKKRDEASGFQIKSTLEIANILAGRGESAKAAERYKKILELRDYKDSHNIAEKALERINKD